MTPLDLAAFEEDLGLLLPDDYRRFLLEYNGGHPTPQYWCVDAQWSGKFAHLTQQLGSRITLHNIYRLQAGHIDDIRDWKVSLSGEIPSNALPIGDSPSPVFLLILDGKDCGKVMVWLPDTNPEQDQTRVEHLGFVANSFSEFMDGLYYVAP